MMKRVLLLLCFGLFICSCNKNSETENKERSAVLDYLSSEENYQNRQQYGTFFNKNYEKSINEKNYQNAAELLVKYGTLVVDLNGSDSLVYRKMLHFLKMNYPQKNDTVNARIYMLISKQLQHHTKMDSSNIYAEKAITYSQNFPSSNIYLDSKVLLAANYSYMSQCEKAIPIFVEVLKKADQKKDHDFLGFIHYNLAYCYDSFYAYEQAEKFYKKAGDEYMIAKDTAMYINLQSTFIANNFVKVKDTQKTLRLIAATNPIYKTYKNPNELTIVDMRDTYMLKHFLKKEFDSALFCNEFGKNYYKKINNNFFLDYYEAKEIEILFYKNGFLKNYEKVLKLANASYQTKDFSTAKKFFNLLYLDAVRNNEIQKALAYRNLEMKSDEIVQKQNVEGKLFEFDKKYQSEKREKQIAKQKAEIQKNNFYIIALILALGLFAALVILYLNKLKQKKISEEKNRNEQFIFDLLENVEIERNRIAYELHDSVNHSLLSVKNAILNKKIIESESISNIIEEVREISRNLYPVILEKVGLAESIKSLSENFSNETDLFVTAEIYYPNKIEKSKELHLYRIIQEALNNTLKHGHATISKIKISTDEKFLILNIKDNGEGFDVEKQSNSKNSFGLQGITQRALVLNASLDIKSDNSGTEINLKMPIL